MQIKSRFYGGQISQNAFHIEQKQKTPLSKN